MKCSLFHLIFIIIFGSVVYGFSIPKVAVKVLKPKGIEFSLQGLTRAWALLLLFSFLCTLALLSRPKNTKKKQEIEIVNKLQSTLLHLKDLGSSWPTFIISDRKKMYSQKNYKRGTLKGILRGTLKTHKNHTLPLTKPPCLTHKTTPSHQQNHLVSLANPPLISLIILRILNVTVDTYTVTDDEKPKTIRFFCKSALKKRRRRSIWWKRWNIS